LEEQTIRNPILFPASQRTASDLAEKPKSVEFVFGIE